MNLSQQSYASDKTMAYAEALRRSMQATSSSVGQEVSDKYAAVTEELVSELTPVLDLVLAELERLGAQAERSRRRLARMYRTNDFYSKDIGDYVV